jgi:signal transduction histidine kinase
MPDSCSPKVPNIGPEERRLTEIIRNNSGRVSGIINNVLQPVAARGQSRPERHAARRRMDRGIPGEFCETMQGREAIAAWSSGMPGLEVRFDPEQLRQIVWNLCENALKRHTEGRQVHVEIRYRPLESDNGARTSRSPIAAPG